MRRKHSEAIESVPIGFASKPVDSGIPTDGPGVGTQQFVETLTAESQEWICLLEGDGTIRHLSAATAWLLGMPPQQMVGKAIHDYVATDSLPSFVRMLAEVLGTPDRRVALDVALLGADGQAIRLRGTAVNRLRQTALKGLVLTARMSEPGALGGVDRSDLLAACRSLLPKNNGRYALLAVTLSSEAVGEAALGHIRTELLYAALAERIAADLEGAEIVARSGPTTLCALLDGISDRSAVAEIAASVQEALAAPLRVGDLEVPPVWRIGFAVSKDGSRLPEDVLAEAEAASHHRRPSRQSAPQAFLTSMRTADRRQVALIGALPGAVERGELDAVYQPIVRLADGRIVAFEALMRWLHPDLGTISPAEFVPLAEGLGLMTALDRWILRESAMRAASWGANGPKVHVNVSAVQLDDPELLSAVDDALSSYRFAPERLVIEITETALQEGHASPVGLLAALADLGVGLAVGGFPNGRVSLAELATWPVDTFKISGRLLTGLADNPQRQALLRGVIYLIHQLGRSSVAQGIDDARAYGLLANMGCMSGQGYLFSAPIPGWETGTMLRGKAPWLEGAGDKKKRR